MEGGYITPCKPETCRGGGGGGSASGGGDACEDKPNGPPRSVHKKG